jgi:hypothetical protein
MLVKTVPDIWTSNLINREEGEEGAVEGRGRGGGQWQSYHAVSMLLSRQQFVGLP